MLSLPKIIPLNQEEIEITHEEKPEVVMERILSILEKIHMRLINIEQQLERR